AGIGPEGHLREMGIPVLKALPGVGQRLMDHPSVAIASFLKPSARVRNELSRRHMHLAMRYSSEIGGAPAGDMFVIGNAKSSWHKVGEQISAMLVFTNKTYSETGEVKLSSPNWNDEPSVDFNLLSDKRDLDRLMDAVRRLAPLFEDPAMKAVTSNPFPAAYSDKVRQVGAITTKNKILTTIAARLLDGPKVLRDYLIENYLMEDFTLDEVCEDDDRAEAFIRRAAVGVWHASCTCRMGAGDDPMAVTDNQGRVRGVSGLRVVDASIFPVVPCANTNFPTIMTAEKIADEMLGAS
ncbi:MAG: GMC oxidoreductase, partial [Pseudomonadota bacterium]|nr:GMC oxidoreductase [Pseudomonadota bacterium]